MTASSAREGGRGLKLDEPSFAVPIIASSAREGGRGLKHANFHESAGKHVSSAREGGRGLKLFSVRQFIALDRRPLARADAD